jgi:hypothetical protein
MYFTSPSNNPEKTTDVLVRLSLQNKTQTESIFQILANNNTEQNLFGVCIHFLPLIVN